MLADVGQVHEPVDRAQQMIHWHMPLEVEAVEQRFLRHRPLDHHRPALRFLAKIESDHQPYLKAEFFNTIDPLAVVKAHAQSLRMDEPEPRSCCCATLTNLAAVPMGGDGLDERVFATVERIRDYGDGRRWLYLSKCSLCEQNWMIAQEETVLDQYFLRRLSASEAAATLEGHWPDDFKTYQRVLEVGHLFTTPCVFLNPLAYSLRWQQTI